MNHLFAKLVLWFCKLLAAIFLVATNVMNAVQANPDKLVWQTVPVRTEPALTQPSAATQASLVGACGGPPSKTSPMALVPPAVEQIGSFPLDDYGTAVAWSPNGELLATSETFGRIIKIWSFPGLKMIRKIDLGQIGTERLIFTSDNDFLITSSAVPYSTSGRPALSIFDIKTGEIVRNIDGPDDATHFPLANFPRDFVESPDAKLLFLMLHADMTTYVYDTKSWTIVGKFDVSADEISSGPGANQVTLSNLPLVCSGENPDTINSRNEQIIIWDQVKHAYIYYAPLFSGLFSPNTMSVSSSYCMMAFGALSVHQKVPKTINNPIGYQVWAPPNEAIKVWDLRSQKITNIIGHPVIYNLSFDNALPILAVAEEDNTTRLYYLIDQHETFMMMSLHTFNEESYKLSFSPNGKYLAAVGDEQVVLYKIGD